MNFGMTDSFRFVGITVSEIYHQQKKLSDSKSIFKSFFSILK